MASLQLGTYNGDIRKCDKSSLITWNTDGNGEVITQFVEIENGSNIEHYIIVLDNINDDFNYAKINDNYYFIEPVNNGSNTVNTFEFTLDYYYTFKDIILNTECIIERSASFSNAYLVDNDYIISSKTETITKAFPNSANNDTIVLMTVG